MPDSQRVSRFMPAADANRRPPASLPNQPSAGTSRYRSPIQRPKHFEAGLDLPSPLGVGDPARALPPLDRRHARDDVDALLDRRGHGLEVVMLRQERRLRLDQQRVPM